ncbi:MAG: SDR family oxidoreductase [Chloroflexi bacterium]|nr:SDR family oxidoreductase [Chloroflexota bacterium]
MFTLEGKVAIVTGASRGIGAAIAIALADAGASVSLISRTAPQPEVISSLEKTGRLFAHISADLSQMQSIPLVVGSTLNRFGRIDILVNNAGIIRRTPFLEYSETDWDVIVNTNLKVPFFLAQACARQMLAQEHVGQGAESSGQRGKIINICSVLSFQGGILVPAYTAAKHGLAGVTKAMANELAPQGINVNGLAPGYVRTENTAPLQSDPQRFNAIVARIPAGRWGDPADIAGAAVFLASSASDYMQGQILTVDGGWLAR